jgi:hypothetical protein
VIEIKYTFAIIMGAPLGVIGSAILGATFSVGAKRSCECNVKYKCKL